MKKIKLIFWPLIIIFTIASLYLAYGGIMSYIQWQVQPTLQLVGGETTTISQGFRVQGNIYFGLMGASLLINIVLIIIFALLKKKHK